MTDPVPAAPATPITAEHAGIFQECWNDLEAVLTKLRNAFTIAADAAPGAVAVAEAVEAATGNVELIPITQAAAGVVAAANITVQSDTAEHAVANLTALVGAAKSVAAAASQVPPKARTADGGGQPPPDHGPH